MLGPLGTKLQNFLGPHLCTPLAHENLRRNLMFSVKMVGVQGF